jgi:WD40 repeat protein
MNYNSQRVVFENVSQQQLKLLGFKIDLQATTAVETPIDFTDEQSMMRFRRKSVSVLSPRPSVVELRSPLERIIPRISADTVKFNFRCHRDSITSLSLLELDTQFLITSSLDNYVKFWDMNAKHDVSDNPMAPSISPLLICSINLNHPLPSLWNLRDNQTTKEHRKVLFAMRVVDIMFRKFKDEIMPSEEKYLSLQPLFDHLSQRSLPSLASIVRKPDDIVVM